MKNLLLLSNRYTADDNDIWRAAIRRGWSTERTNRYHVKGHMEGFDNIRYYGNTLHAEQLKELLPFTFTDIDYSILAKARDYTKRKIDYIRYENLGQPIKQTHFIKPAKEKWFEAKVYKAGDNIVGGSCDKDDYIYVSEVVDFVDEVRCFVLDGEILTSSLYRINHQVWDITGLPPDLINFDKKINDTPIPEMVKKICSEYKLPRGAVIDFGYETYRDWSLIEFNEAWASGLYYCDYDKCFDVIINSQHTNHDTKN